MAKNEIIEEDVNLDRTKEDTGEDEVRQEEGVVLKKETKQAPPEIEIEVVDDLPEAERRLNESRKEKLKKEDEISELPASKDALEEEIKDYGKRSQQRIRHLYLKYQEERSAREAATRENEEAIRYAQGVTGELTKTREYLSKGETYLLEQVKKRTELALNEAKRKYEVAYAEGDASKIADALVEMNNAAAEKREADAFKPLQVEKKGVQDEGTDGSSAQTTRRAVPQPDPQAVAWAEKNPWFGKDEVMTATAYGLHSSFVKAGMDARSDAYYSKLDAEMRKHFPDRFQKSSAESETTRSSARSVVAGVTRTGPSKKVTLTSTQVAIAKRLGVPIEMYAKQILLERGNS